MSGTPGLGPSGDPAFEAERRRQMHRLRMWAARQPKPAPGQPPADPIHVLACRVDGIPPGARLICLARWSLAARLVQDAIDGGYADEAQNLGPDAMQLANADPAVLPPGLLVRVGVAKAGEWLAWFLPGGPVEPPPEW
jgi:hypothetical protein